MTTTPFVQDILMREYLPYGGNHENVMHSIKKSSLKKEGINVKIKKG